MSITREERGGLLLLASVIFVSMVIGATIARCQDFDAGLDLPVEKPTLTPPKAIFTKLLKQEPYLPPPPPPENGDDRPPTFFGQEIKTDNRTLIYVVDISGTMAYDVASYTDVDGAQKSGNRLARAKAELRRSIATLPDDIHFNVLAYDCNTYLWEKDLQPATAGDKVSAIQWCNALEALGGTATGPATAVVLQDRRVACVVLLSDGAPNCGLGGSSDPGVDWHRMLIRVANTRPAVVNCYGIGCSGIFRDFMQGVASDNNGTYTDVR